MKKVLYIGGFELPDKNAAAQRVISNGKALRELGHEVAFVGLTKSPPQKYQYQGFHCHELIYPDGIIEWISFLFSIREEAELINRYNPDVLIFYNYPSFKLARLRKRFNNKVIFGDITEWYESSGLSLTSVVKRIDVWLRMRVILPKLDGLIVISDYLESFYNGKVKNLINIPPLVDIQEDKWQSFIDSSVPKNKYNLVYAGSPGAGNKDRLDLVISSVKRARLELGKEIHINIIGINKDQFLNNFGISIEQDIDDIYVHFLGRISHLEALGYVKEADYSIFFRDDNLTNRAGFPTKFVESISSGTPVITNPSSCLNFYFEKYPHIGYFINDLTKETLVNGIKLAFSISLDDLESKKIYCKKLEVFDYRKYTNRFHELLKNG